MGKKETGWGNSTALAGETGPVSSLAALWGVVSEDIPLEQSRVKMLQHALDQVKVIDGQRLHPNSIPHPHETIAIIKDRLYRVSWDMLTGEENT